MMRKFRVYLNTLAIIYLWRFASHQSYPSLQVADYDTFVTGVIDDKVKRVLDIWWGEDFRMCVLGGGSQRVWGEEG